ncbi:MAG TPA: RES family NAD+ phosphorylase [Elusimicrobiota bacterium]|nr:RES family NAD+ phosphorylase [Elusimicrobiota bacterium]
MPNAFESTALESGPSFTKDRRYSVQGEFGAVYFSGSKTLSEFESDERGGEDAERLSYLAFALTVDKLVDLTLRKTRDHLGVRLDDLVRPRTAKDRYEVTQAVARQIYARRLNGLIVPSVHDPKRQKPDWFNVVLYPAHLLRVCLRPIP